MKKVFALLLALWAAIPCWAEDPAYTDIDAETYIYNRGISDRTEIERIHAWHRGLKNLQLYTNIVHMASLRSQHGAVSNSTDIYPMVGGKITLVGGVTQTTNGLYYTNSTSDYAWFANPLSTNPVAFSVVTAFASQPKGSQQALIGSYNGGASLKGPSMTVHGSAQDGSNPHVFYNYFTTDGSSNPGGHVAYAGNYGGRFVQGYPQFAAWSWSTNGVRFVSGIQTNQTTATNYAAAWNMNTNWFMGRLQEAAYAFKGTIAMETIFNKNLSQYEIDAVRRLYQKTIGKGYVPETIVIWEGDSLTSGANTEFIYQKHLYTNEIWGPKVTSRQLAISGATTSSALGRFTNNVLPLLVDKDYASDIYYSLFIGTNDIGTGTTANDAYIAIKYIWTLARGFGLKVIAWTIPPDGTMTIARNEQRNILNQMIRTSSGRWDKLVDLAATDPFRETSVTNNTTYYQSDHQHFTSEGHKVISEAIVRAINTP